MDEHRAARIRIVDKGIDPLASDRVTCHYKMRANVWLPDAHSHEAPTRRSSRFTADEEEYQSRCDGAAAAFLAAETAGIPW
jgi:hypothetical protein